MNTSTCQQLHTLKKSHVQTSVQASCSHNRNVLVTIQWHLRNSRMQNTHQTHTMQSVHRCKCVETMQPYLWGSTYSHPFTKKRTKTDTRVHGECKEKNMDIVWLAPKLHNTLCSLKGHSLAVVSTFTSLGQWLGSFLPPPSPLLSCQKQKKAQTPRKQYRSYIIKCKDWQLPCERQANDSAAQNFMFNISADKSKQKISQFSYNTSEEKQKLPSSAFVNLCHYETATPDLEHFKFSNRVRFH